ncbi:MAG: dihydrodipicolinate reductase C-terminal domain-containing protein [Bdellovibrionota bacterium]
MAKGSKIKLALIGANGRLGRSIQEVSKTEFAAKIEISALVTRENIKEFKNSKPKADVLLDVSLPTVSGEILKSLLKRPEKIPYVIGCTGWEKNQFQVVKRYSENACAVYAPNFSPGVNLFLTLIEQAAPLLKEWGYDVSLHETHHTKKKDSPSGTAKAILERLGDLKAQIHCTRAGNIVGTHEVRFVGPGDILTLNHEALDRTIFARGAILAALWAARKKQAGLFSMKDVLFK